MQWLDVPALRPPGVNPTEFLKREDEQLSRAVRSTTSTLVSSILAMLVLELLDLWR
jgi:hypothetical protein